MPQVLLVKLSAIAASNAAAINITNAEIAGTEIDKGNAVSEIVGTQALSINGMAVAGILDVGGMCCDYSGNTFITDPTQHIIVKVSESGKVNVIAGVIGVSGNNKAKQRVPVGTAATTGPSGNIGPALFNTPTGICCDKSGNLYVADSGNNQIRKVTLDGYVDVIAGNGATTAGLVDAAVDPLQSMFSNPTAVAVDNSGVIYVADQTNNAIRRIGFNSGYIGVTGSVSGVVSTIAGGVAGNNDNCRATKNPGANNIFRAPNGIAVDGKGRIFIMDNGNYKIKRIGFSQTGMADLTGTKVAQGTSWVFLHSGIGTQGRSLGTDPDKAYTCQYGGFPIAGIAVDRYGYQYVLDNYSGDQRLLKIDPNGVPSVICDFTQASSYNTKLAGVAVSPAQKVFIALKK